MGQACQGDLFRGLRMHTEPSGALRLEGTVDLAARYTGLSRRQILQYIEDGEIQARSPGANRTDAGSKDAKGRRLGYKFFVNMRDVFRIAYGREQGEALLKELGV